MALMFISDKAKSDSVDPKSQQSGLTEDRVFVMIEKVDESDTNRSYPFPLKRDLNPPQDLFRNTIKRLRKYIHYLKKDRPDSGSEISRIFMTDANIKLDSDQKGGRNTQLVSVNSTKTDLGSVYKENEELRTKLEELLRDNERLKNSTGAVKFEALLTEKTSLEKEVKILKQRTEDLELQCASNFHLKKELKRKEKELEDLKAVLLEFEVAAKMKTRRVSNRPLGGLTKNRRGRFGNIRTDRHQKFLPKAAGGLKNSRSQAKVGPGHPRALKSNSKMVGYNKHKGSLAPGRRYGKQLGNSRKNLKGGMPGMSNQISLYSNFFCFSYDFDRDGSLFEHEELAGEEVREEEEFLDSGQGGRVWGQACGCC